MIVLIITFYNLVINGKNDCLTAVPAVKVTGTEPSNLESDLHLFRELVTI